MKEQRKGPLGRVGDIAETLAAGAKRRQQAREPRVLLYDEAGEPRVLHPGMKGRDELVEHRRAHGRARGDAVSLLPPELAQAALGRALARGGDWAELYAEERTGFRGGARRPARGAAAERREVGASIRVVSGEASYFGHVDGLAEPDLLALADSVSQALRQEARNAIAPPAPHSRAAYEVVEQPEDVPAERKVELLRTCDEAARAAGPEIAQVSATYAEGRRVVAIFNSGGFAAGDDRTRVRLGVQVVARREERVETGHETRGGHAGFEVVADRPEEVAEAAARKALTVLDAVDAPAGRMPVVVGNGFGGVLLHEAIGHGLEADAVQKTRALRGAGRRQAGRGLRDGLRRRPPAGRVGQRRGRRRGDPDAEDDDHRGRQAHLVPLRQPARAQGQGAVDGQRPARVLPPPAAPAHDQHVLRARRRDARGLDRGIDRGLYAVSFGGGQVEPATGDFVFGVSEGYLIEDGKVTAPVRGATLVGNGLEALAAMDGIAGDLEIATGYCGKGGQRVPAGVGQPHVRIRA